MEVFISEMTKYEIWDEALEFKVKTILRSGNIIDDFELDSFRFMVVELKGSLYQITKNFGVTRRCVEFKKA